MYIIIKNREKIHLLEFNKFPENYILNEERYCSNYLDNFDKNYHKEIKERDIEIEKEMNIEKEYLSILFYIYKQ